MHLQPKARNLLLAFVMAVTAANQHDMRAQSALISSAMSSISFDKWIADQRKVIASAWYQNPKSEWPKPVALSDALMQRIKSGRVVSSASVTTVVDTWSEYERHNALTGKVVFPATKKLIDDIVVYVDDKAMVAQLYLKKARLAGLEGNDSDAAVYYERSFKSFDSIHISIDRNRLESLVGMANALHATGQTKQAEPLYLEALSYPWWQIEGNAEALQEMRALYIQAGRNLIDIRRNDLQGLKNIVFIPAVREDLAPYLQQRIEEAQEKEK